MLLNRLQSKLIDTIIREESRATLEARDDADLVLRRAALDEAATFDEALSNDVDDELRELAESLDREIDALLEGYRRKALGVIKRSTLGRRFSLAEMRQYVTSDNEALAEAKNDAALVVQCALQEYGQCLVASLVGHNECEDI